MKRIILLLPAVALSVTLLLLSIVSGSARGLGGADPQLLPQAGAVQAVAPVARPYTMHYQGNLFDKNGQPVNGSADLRFQIFDVTLTLQWEEEYQSVPVTSGYFEVQLGSINPLPPELFRQEELYLFVSVNLGEGWEELPYEPFGYAPWAFYADIAAFADFAREAELAYSALYADEAGYSAEAGHSTTADFAGSAGSVPWSGVTGKPAGFADGVDNDALGMLGPCAAGQIAKWSGSEWECAADEAGAVAIDNLIIVAKSGGDFTTIPAALNSIADASATNPYLVWVAPGVYNQAVTMKPFVHLQGAGQEATIIASGTTNTVTLAENSSLRDLTIENSALNSGSSALLVQNNSIPVPVTGVTIRAAGNAPLHYGVRVSNGALSLEQVTVLAENAGDTNIGLTVESPSAPSTVAIADSRFIAGGGGNSAVAIFAGGADSLLTAANVSALAEDSNANMGLQLLGATAYLNGGSYIGRVVTSGSSAFGINVGAGSTLDAVGVTARAENAGVINRGLINSSGSVTLHGGSYAALAGNESAGLRNEGVDADLRAESISAECVDAGSCYALYSINGLVTLVGGLYRAIGSGTDYAIYHAGNGLLNADGATIEGDEYGFFNNNAAAELVAATISGNTPVSKTGGNSITVSNSRLVGGPVSGAVTCLLVSRDVNAMVTGPCP